MRGKVIPRGTLESHTRAGAITDIRVVPSREFFRKRKGNTDGVTAPVCRRALTWRQRKKWHCKRMLVEDGAEADESAVGVPAAVVAVVAREHARRLVGEVEGEDVRVRLDVARRHVVVEEAPAAGTSSCSSSRTLDVEAAESVVDQVAVVVQRAGDVAVV